MCLQSQCWTPIQPIPPNPTTHTNLTVIFVAAFVCITLILFIMLRNKVRLFFGNIVEHFNSRNNRVDASVSASDLLDEINRDLDHSPPIYNPTTSRGILPPLGYR